MSFSRVQFMQPGVGICKHAAETVGIADEEPQLIGVKTRSYGKLSMACARAPQTE